jgi:AcrR family transcriptional regulator
MAMARLKAPERREQLMEVAARLFAEHGYDATTTAAIAEAAGITEPVLYRHFENKKDMFKAILRDATERMISYWHEVISGIQDPAEVFLRMGECMGDHLQQMRLSHQVVQGALATVHDPEVKDVLRQHYAQFLTLISDLIRRGQEAGVFRKDLDPITAAWALINIGTGHFLVKLSLDIQGMDARAAVEIAINGLRAETPVAQ